MYRYFPHLSVGHWPLSGATHFYFQPSVGWCAYITQTSDATSLEYYHHHPSPQISFLFEVPNPLPLTTVLLYLSIIPLSHLAFNHPNHGSWLNLLLCFPLWHCSRSYLPCHSHYFHLCSKSVTAHLYKVTSSYLSSLSTDIFPVSIYSRSCQPFINLLKIFLKCKSLKN